jgi:peptidyl-prolyl cis-trans isomerase SurA
MNRLLTLLFILLVFSLSAQQIADKVVAVVGDQVILYSDIENQYNSLNAQSQTPVPAEKKCELFDNLLLEKLFVSQAQIDSVVCTPEEVEAELDRKIRYFVALMGSKEKLEEYYGKSVSQMKDDFRSDIENQLVAEKMRNKILTGLKVSPQEVKDYFNAIPADSVPYFNSEVEIGQIVMFPKVTEEEKETARKKIEKIRREIEGGLDFSLQAILYSEDPGSASEGGALGLIERGELVPEFEAVAFKQKEGELSLPVESPFGFHLIITDEKRGNKIKCRHILIKPKTSAMDLARVKNTMDSILVELRAGRITFREAVNNFSDDEQSKNIGGLMTNPKTGTPYFEKSEIEGGLIFTIDKMPVGSYSDVLSYTNRERSGDMTTGYRIIWLKSETAPHKADLSTDYARIQLEAKTAKTRRELENWVAIYKSKNFIRIDESMYYCPSIQKWRKQDVFGQ